MKSVEALCKGIESNALKSSKGEVKLVMIPTLCKQILFALMSEAGKTEKENEEIDKLSYALKMVLVDSYRKAELLNEPFQTYGDTIITTSTNVINRCFETKNKEDPHVSSILNNITAILYHCSRGTEKMRNKIANFDALLKVLLTTLNGAWKGNDETIRINTMGTLANLPRGKTIIKFAEFPNLLDSVMEIICTESGQLKGNGVAFIVNLSFGGRDVALIIAEKPKLLHHIGKLLRGENIQLRMHALMIFDKLATSETIAVKIEECALNDLLSLFEKQKEGETQSNQNMLLFASRILAQLAKGVSKAVMADKPGIVEKFYEVLIDASNSDELRKNAIIILERFASYYQSSAHANFKKLIDSFKNLLSIKTFNDKITFSLLYKSTHDVDTQVVISSTDGLLEVLSTIISNDDSTDLSRVRASCIFLNLSTTKECHEHIVKNKQVLAAIINVCKQNTTEEGGQAESRVLLIRTLINLATNKANRKILGKNVILLGLLTSACAPRKTAFVGAKDALVTILP